MNDELSDRQNDIINATIELIGEKGVQGLTIKLLAERVGVSEPALYRHFDSKQDILLAVLNRFEENTKRMFALAAASGKTGIEQIETVYMHHFKTFSERPSVAAIIFSADYFIEDKRLASQVISIMKNTETNLIRIIESGGKKEFRTDIPKKELAVILMGSLRLLVTRWRLTDYGFDLVRQGKTLWKALKKCITDKPG